MIRISRPAGLILRARRKPGLRPLPTINGRVPAICSFSSSATASSPARTFWDDYRESYSFEPQDLTDWRLYQSGVQHVVGKPFCGIGYVKKIKSISKKLCFVQVLGVEENEELQLVATNKDLCDTIRGLDINCPVYIEGSWHSKRQPDSITFRPLGRQPRSIDSYEISVSNVQALNRFPNHIQQEGIPPPELRYLQIRLDEKLRRRLRVRSEVSRFLHQQLAHDGFQEVETPILFKSTPEGANEFIVPTRKAGQAYALPQSPQQYKQILMASGIRNYYQFARCFRDEDLRADRQPEFTQVDIEMAFASGNTVMKRIEILIDRMYSKFSKKALYNVEFPSLPPIEIQKLNFPRMNYQEAMLRHGSDKPDLRIKGLIYDHGVVTEDLSKMLTNVEDPKIEFCHFSLGSPSQVRTFLSNFMSSPEAEPFRANPNGAPGFAIYDSQKPMQGLQIFGHEGTAALTEFYEHQSSSTDEEPLSDGSLIILQARENIKRFSGGSTMLGNLRRAIYKAAIAEGLVEVNPIHHYLWITDFPMFTPEDGIDPGQGGTAGFKATHHPFTAPKSAADIELLKTSPLDAVADHYDLVVNGVELGGGSRRIHNVDVQRYVMRDVLKMPEERMADFSHLLGALEAGCPPHAGIALGFDRLVAVLSGAESLRDVIAFPKSSKGDDLMVRSPSAISDKVLERYHLRLDKKESS